MNTIKSIGVAGVCLLVLYGCDRDPTAQSHAPEYLEQKPAPIAMPMAVVKETAYAKIEIAPSCSESEHDPYGPDSIELSKPSVNVIATVYTSTNCGNRIVDPDAIVDAHVVLLTAVETDPDPEVTAACNCAHRLTYSLKQPVSRGVPVKFSLSGRAAIEAAAP